MRESLEAIARRQARAIAQSDRSPERARELAKQLTEALGRLTAEERERRVALIDGMLWKRATKV